MKHAFVTGATGYIGRRLVELLSSRGIAVTCLVRCNSTAPAGRAIVGDLLDPAETLAESMCGCDTLFHLAATVSFAPSAREQLHRINGDGTGRILEAARMAGVSRVVVVSSACTIGLSHDPSHVLDEDSPVDERLAARNPYLASKLDAESHAFAAATAGQHVVIVNPTTVFGPGDRTLNSGTMFQQVARARVLPVPPGGTNVGDIADVADGLFAAAERGVSGRRYILGGHNITFAELFSEIARVIGRAPRFVRIGSYARLPMRSVAWAIHHVAGSRIITPQIVDDTFAYKYFASERAARELGWSPRVQLHDTLSAAWTYYRAEGLIVSPMEAAA